MDLNLNSMLHLSAVAHLLYLECHEFDLSIVEKTKNKYTLKFTRKGLILLHSFYGLKRSTLTVPQSLVICYLSQLVPLEDSEKKEKFKFKR